MSKSKLNDVVFRVVTFLLGLLSITLCVFATVEESMVGAVLGAFMVYAFWLWITGAWRK